MVDVQLATVVRQTSFMGVHQKPINDIRCSRFRFCSKHLCDRWSNRNLSQSKASYLNIPSQGEDKKMAGYTRQSIADIINGADITAPPVNAEFNQLAAAFHGTTGHSHDGLYW